MGRFQKVVLKTLKVPEPQVVEYLDFIVKDLDLAVCQLDLALRPFRKAPIEPDILAKLELCLKIMGTSAIILRTKYLRDIWDTE